MKIIKLLLFLTSTILLNTAEIKTTIKPKYKNKSFYLMDKAGGKKFKIPVSAAIQSKFIKESLEYDPNETVLPVLIPADILEILIKGLIVIDKNKDKKPLNVVDIIVKNVLDNVQDKDLVPLVINANKLLSPILEKAVQKKYAMALKKNRKQLIKAAIANFNKDLRYEIAKEYYLLYAKNIKLRNPDPEIKEKGKEVSFSIEDLLIHGRLKETLKNFFIEEYYEYDELIDEYKYVPQLNLNLSGLNLSSLNGLEKIPKIETAKEINLFNNKISNLNGINVAKNVKRLNLSNNRIKSLGENLKGLTDLETLILINNNLRILENSLDNLPKLTHVYLQNNPIKAVEAQRLTYKYPRIKFEFDETIQQALIDLEQQALHDLEQKAITEAENLNQALIKKQEEDLKNVPGEYWYLFS